MNEKEDFWEAREQVERFAAREPDLRLQALTGEYSRPASVRVLDVGCAGGRNTVFLACRRLEVWAIDSATAMVEETRSRLAPILGEKEARRRVRRGRMDRLNWPSAYFDLVVALGVYHCAESSAEWERALSESARVLRPGGRCLVSVFTPETDLTGRGIRLVPGETDVYEGFPGGGRVYLVDAAGLDTAMRRQGLEPLSPTDTVRREAQVGRRVSANGLYVKRRTEPGTSRHFAL